ncbi:zinc finger protein ZAT11-like [Apium graveolens]|uniref:zinc finger protein ZAT11-like n=1 Tax=Apium graveolens TaxID=4045 RepID=UPI003D79CCF0
MVYFSMKRDREANDHFNESITNMANYLILLSRGNIMIDNSPTTARVFECKTCNRQFTSFQALGGHRASHKKPRLMGLDNLNDHAQEELSPPKPKVHECSICGLEFAIGQALGGHMRRHRGGDGAAVNEKMSHDLPSINRVVIPVVKKSNSRRVMGLDLNLTPLENDIEFELEIENMRTGNLTITPAANYLL